MTTEEQTARMDLDVSHYPGKWKVAKQMALSKRHYADSRHLLPYWERVRLFYLELGGERLDKERV